MKILGLGVPELIVVVLIIVVIAAIVLAVMGSSKREGASMVGPVQPEKSGRSGVSVSDLKGYKDLFDMGAITQDEYDAKKREILGI